MRGRPPFDHLVSVPNRRPGAPARDVAGTGLLGGSRWVELARPGHWTLVLFLGSACDACAPFWPAVADPVALGLEEGDEVVILVRETDDLDAVRSLAAGLPESAEPVVVSPAAWRAFGAQGPPFFALVDGSRVTAEGVAWSCEQVGADVRRARSR